MKITKTLLCVTLIAFNSCNASALTQGTNKIPAENLSPIQNNPQIMLSEKNNPSVKCCIDDITQEEIDDFLLHQTPEHSSPKKTFKTEFDSDDKFNFSSSNSTKTLSPTINFMSEYEQGTRRSRANLEASRRSICKAGTETVLSTSYPQKYSSFLNISMPQVLPKRQLVYFRENLSHEAQLRFDILKKRDPKVKSLGYITKDDINKYASHFPTHEEIQGASEEETLRALAYISFSHISYNEKSTELIPVITLKNQTKPFIFNSYNAPSTSNYTEIFQKNISVTNNSYLNQRTMKPFSNSIPLLSNQINQTIINPKPQKVTLRSYSEFFSKTLGKAYAKNIIERQKNLQKRPH